MALLSSCGGKKGTLGHYKVGTPYQIGEKWYEPKEEPDYDEVGMASWYGSDFHNKKTANGGIFNRNALTAAHRTLPLPSMVRVTNLSNNKTLIVMVNDRGPFAKGRIIDMSERAADILGFRNSGIAKVRVQFLPGQTKRLLADLPGASGANLPDDTDDDTLSKATILQRIFKPKKEEISATIAPSSAPMVIAPLPPSINIAYKATPQTNEKPQVIVGNNDLAAPLTETDGSFSDAENENPSPILNNLVKKEPATKPMNATEGNTNKNTGDGIKNISQEVSFIQAGTYGIEGNAERVKKKLAPLGMVNIEPIKINGKLLYRVKIGPILDNKSAALTLKKTINLGHPDAIIVKEGGKP